MSYILLSTKQYSAYWDACRLIAASACGKPPHLPLIWMLSVCLCISPVLSSPHRRCLSNALRLTLGVSLPPEQSMTLHFYRTSWVVKYISVFACGLTAVHLHDTGHKGCR